MTDDNWCRLEDMINNNKQLAYIYLTCEYPVSFWLALVSMDTHGWPPSKETTVMWQDKWWVWMLPVYVYVFYCRTDVITEGIHFSLRLALSPIPPHLSRQIITTFLGLHKDDGFVLLFCHNLLHQLQKSVDNERRKDCQDTYSTAALLSSVSTVSKDEFVLWQY